MVEVKDTSNLVGHFVSSQKFCILFITDSSTLLVSFRIGCVLLILLLLLLFIYFYYIAFFFCSSFCGHVFFMFDSNTWKSHHKLRYLR